MFELFWIFAHGGVENLANQLANGAVNFEARGGTWQAVQRAEQGLLKPQCSCNLCETCKMLLQAPYFLEVRWRIVTLCAQRISLFLWQSPWNQRPGQSISVSPKIPTNPASGTQCGIHVLTALAHYRSTAYTGSQYVLCVLCLRVSTPNCRCRPQWKPGKIFLSSVCILNLCSCFWLFLYILCQGMLKLKDLKALR